MVDKDAFAREALGQIPKILTLLDRNAHSTTYGCFDRNFWHYKIIDFPSGMAQEFVWPLALVYALDMPGNVFHQSPAIREWILAGMRYAARSAHGDGSCDDYFPYEKAGGAAAFSLLACLESYAVLGIEDSELIRFFQTRASWLAHHRESGQLTNHQALIVLCLLRLDEITGGARWESAAMERLALVLDWQHEEGWFQEYEGCDPGYHTLTISILAAIHERRPGARLHDALVRAVRVASEFVHPDGSFGGEYASRNTYNFFPHGFEVFGRHFPEALAVNDRFLNGLRAGLGPCYADDHIIGHHTWNYLLAWRDFAPDRPDVAPRKDARIAYPGAGLRIERRSSAELYLALNKGGVFKFFRDGALLVSDTQISLQVRHGKKERTAVAHLVGASEVEETADGWVIRGEFGWAKHKAMTPFRLIALRLIMLCGGRWHPDLVRKLLQRVLITGKAVAPFRFRRELKFEGNRLKVTDRVEADRWSDVVGAGIGPDQTSIYVVMSRTFQRGQLTPWLSLTDRVRALKDGDALELTREW